MKAHESGCGVAVRFEHLRACGRRSFKPMPGIVTRGIAHGDNHDVFALVSRGLLGLEKGLHEERADAFPVQLGNDRDIVNKDSGGRRVWAGCKRSDREDLVEAGCIKRVVVPRVRDEVADYLSVRDSCHEAPVRERANDVPEDILWLHKLNRVDGGLDAHDVRKIQLRIAPGNGDVLFKRVEGWGGVQRV